MSIFGASSINPKREIAVGAALSGLVFLISCLVFRRADYAAFFGWDGWHHLSMSALQNYWSGTRISLDLDFMRGIGEFSDPTLYAFEPGNILARLAGAGAPTRWVAVAVEATLTFAVVFWFGRVNGFSRGMAILGAAAACLLSQSYAVPALGHQYLRANPSLIPGFAAVWGIAALFAPFGRGETGWGGRGRVFAAGLALGIYACVASPSAVVIVAPLMVVWAAVQLGFGPVREKWAKASLAAAWIVALSPFLAYVWELNLFGKLIFFPGEMLSDSPTFRDASYFLSPSQAGVLGGAFWYLALGSAILALTDRRVRPTAAALLAGEALCLVAAAARAFGGVGFPSPARFEIALFPVQCLCAAWAIRRSISLFADRQNLPFLDDYPFAMRLVARGSPILLLVWPLALSIPLDSDHAQFRWPPAETAYVRVVRERIGVVPGGPFLGRHAALAPETAVGKSAAIKRAEYDDAFAVEMGNDHRRYGLWMWGVPTFETSGRLTSPFFHAVASRLFGREGEFGQASSEGISRLPINLARAWGISIFTDTRRHDEPGVAYIGVADVGGRELHFHRLTAPNLGTYSPTRVETVSSVREALNLLARPGFDPTVSVVTHDPVTTPLTPASSDGLLVGPGGGLSVKAEADGWSLLVLPLEYSRCLQAENVSGAETRFLRVNVDETGVLFDRKLDLRLGWRFGIFQSQGCRLEDSRDARRLGMADVAGWWPKGEAAP